MTAAPALGVVLVAEEAAGAHVLRLLVEREHRVVAVLSAADPEQKGSVAALAREHGIALLDPANVRDPAFAQRIRAQGVELLLNVHSLLIADAAVLAAPGIGSFNVHPGPLPRYAGLNAPSWAIAEGEQRHAVTVHWMTAAVDAGAIAYEAWFEIGPADTGLRVATACARQATPLVGTLLDAAAAGSIPARPQPAEGRRWFGREVPHDGQLPWQLGARRVVDLVRAADYAPFPSPWGTFVTHVGDVELAVVRAARTGEPADAPPGTIGPARERGVPVSAGDEWVLVERVRQAGAAVAPADALPAGGTCMCPH
jgi:UDP-4-amino-4-deoxy-L-arabinose formyltransferase/UDP-glucuronic acid dehydrogenase (UDP-4-keto-hexauronic acid decarboxylating)